MTFWKKPPKKELPPEKEPAPVLYEYGEDDLKDLVSSVLGSTKEIGYVLIHVLVGLILIGSLILAHSLVW